MKRAGGSGGRKGGERNEAETEGRMNDKRVRGGAEEDMKWGEMTEGGDSDGGGGGGEEEGRWMYWARNKSNKNKVKEAQTLKCSWHEGAKQTITNH